MFAPVIVTYGVMKKASSVVRAEPDVFRYDDGVVEVVGDQVVFVLQDLGSENMAHMCKLYTETKTFVWHYIDSDEVTQLTSVDVRQSSPVKTDFSVSADLSSVRQNTVCRLLFLNDVAEVLLRLPMFVLRPSRDVSSLLYVHNSIVSPVRLTEFGGILSHRTAHGSVLVFATSKEAYIACVRMTINGELERRKAPPSAGDGYVFQHPQLVMRASADSIRMGCVVPDGRLCSFRVSDFNDVSLDDVYAYETLFTPK